MDRGVHNPPRLPLPNPLQILILCSPKEHMRQFLIMHFGFQFCHWVLNSDRPVLVPSVVYRETWHIMVYVLFWDGLESWIVHIQFHCEYLCESVVEDCLPCSNSCKIWWGFLSRNTPIPTAVCGTTSYGVSSVSIHFCLREVPDGDNSRTNGDHHGGSKQ